MKNGFITLIQAFRRLAKSEKRKHSWAILFIPRGATPLRRQTLLLRAAVLRKGYAAVLLHATPGNKARLTHWDSRA